MRYAEFRDQLEDALQDAGLFFRGVDRPVETVDLADTMRRWKVYIYRTVPRSAEPFHVSAAISFYWSPADAARAHTCEEDLLTELIGRRKRPARTERRGERGEPPPPPRLPHWLAAAPPGAPPVRARAA